jgi:hypothetical protein
MKRYQLQYDGAVTLDDDSENQICVGILVCFNAHDHGVPKVGAYLATSKKIAEEHSPRCDRHTKTNEDKSREVFCGAFPVGAGWDSRIETVIIPELDKKARALFPVMSEDQFYKWFKIMNWHKAIKEVVSKAKKEINDSDLSFDDFDGFRDGDGEIKVSKAHWVRVLGNKVF